MPVRSGLPYKPPGLQAATRHGARDPLGTFTGGRNITNLVLATYKKLKKRNGPYIRPVFTKTG